MGYFGIGILHPKRAENMGTLWRSAYQLGASFIFVIGQKYKHQCMDTTKSYKKIPLLQFPDWESFLAMKIYDCQLFCVEATESAVSLTDFQHPKNAIYLLGAEDNGIPKEIYEKYQTIKIPSVNHYSYNVSMAGTILMYDRFLKLNSK